MSRVCIIGCGSIGSRHARNALALGHDVELADLDSSRAWGLGQILCREFSRDVISHHSMETALRFPRTDPYAWDRPDAILIATPANTHAILARQLLDGGYAGPLFTEKPLALSVDDAAVFRDWPHPTTMVGYNWRFNTELTAFAECVQHLPYRWLSCYTNMAQWPGLGARDGDPVGECSHAIDSALHLFGAGAVRSAIRLGQSMTILFDPWVEVLICWDLQGVHSFQAAPQSSGLQARRLAPSPQSIEESYRHELAHFLDCAARGVPTLTPFADGIRVLDVIRQAEALAAVTP